MAGFRSPSCLALIVFLAIASHLPPVWAQGGPCSASAPACDGGCSGGNEECVTDDTGNCVCVPASEPCGTSVAPECDGSCLPNERCREDPTGFCFCEPLTPCGGTFPTCDGMCDTNERCEIEPTTGTSCICEPVGETELSCEDSALPLCGGFCPHGTVCGPDATGGACVCMPSPTPCLTAGVPQCDGACPAFEQCRVDAAGSGCFCSPLDVPCGQNFPPECSEGLCLDGQQCVNLGAVCGCATVDCGSSLAPECGGDCPPDSTCRFDTTTSACSCESDDIDCALADAPECGGLCPAGQACVTDATLESCTCVTIGVPCSAAGAPACDGDCPADQECVDGGVGGGCVCETPLTCGGSAPVCDGACPDGDVCVTLATGCECQPLLVPCSSAATPACGGTCPLDETCTPVIGGACACMQCDTTVPGHDLTIRWTNATVFGWNEIPCADSYNVYRLEAAGMSDGNGDGLADDYGICFMPDVRDLQVSPGADPPPGVAQFFTLRARNAMGEGGSGFTSALLERPNTGPCP